jgi:CRP-like cAMP-binding protein
MVPTPGRRTNRLIAALPAKDRTRLIERCDDVDLPLGRELDLPGERIRHVYFPTESFVSLITPSHGASTLEVGLIGDEGMYGISLALGVSESPLHALVQGGGSALRLSAHAFHTECAASPALRRKLNRYLYVLLTQLAQSAVCTRYHVIEARLARWLLMTHDRAHADTFQVTQKFLAWMLGVRRVGVTNAASALQRRKLIGYSRGSITVLDRRGLEAAACSCYEADKTVYDRILGPARAQ